jgi:hypothetical protein
LIVRGGNPIENTFFIDNIEIPNINHFPSMASSGGPIGMVNVDFIQDVEFFTGGFSAKYGDKLSSIMDISFREGNRNEFDGQLDLNFAGFGGVFEGPLFNQKGSWLFSARRSYLDYLVDVFDVGSSVAPIYGDYQWKVVYDLNPFHKIMVVGLWGDDFNNPDRQTGSENKMVNYGTQDIYERTTGINWRAVWNKNGYSNSSVSLTSTKFEEDFYETNTGLLTYQNYAQNHTFKLRNINHFRLNKSISLELGLEAKRILSDFNNSYAETTNIFGKSIPSLAFQKEISANNLGTFISLIYKPFTKLTNNFGVRLEYFSYNKNITISPRLSFSYILDSKTSINGAVGIFHQNLPLLLLSQDYKNKTLKDPQARHYILGVDHLWSKNTKINLEVYLKDYKNFPIDPKQPKLFPIDNHYFANYGTFNSIGKARAYGVEFMVQKKLVENVYGLVSSSFFRSRYKSGDGIWRNRDFDNRFTVSIEGGYKPNRKLEFSLRWIYAGGTPYTPMNIEASKLKHRAVFYDNRINSDRYPPYHSMNLRFDRRIHFQGSNLIFYLSAWNVYNHKNIAQYYWNDIEQKQDDIYQWQLLPIFGLEFEF